MLAPTRLVMAVMAVVGVAFVLLIVLPYWISLYRFITKRIPPSLPSIPSPLLLAAAAAIARVTRTV